MPIYNDPIKGVSRSVAMDEAAAIAPLQRAMLSAFELRHENIDTVRVVNNFEPIDAVLEDDAAEDAGTTVTFMAGHVEAGKATESDTAEKGEIELVINNVAGQWSAALKLIRGSRAPIYVTERLYASDDLDGPAYLPPITMIVSDSEVSGGAATLKVSYGDFGNVAVPRATFNRVEYPTLSR